MDIKELRIGNLIERNGVTAKIELINNEIDEVYFIGDYFYYNDFCCNINPIPLTEEGLLKFGFERFKNGIGWDTLKKKDFELIEVPTNKGKLMALDKGSGKYLYVKTIHQLQNLYFALTQTELTIS